MWLLYYTGTNTINNLLWYHVNKSLAEIHCMHFFPFYCELYSSLHAKKKKKTFPQRETSSYAAIKTGIPVEFQNKIPEKKSRSLEGTKRVYKIATLGSTH